MKDVGLDPDLIDRVLRSIRIVDTVHVDHAAHHGSSDLEIGRDGSFRVGTAVGHGRLRGGPARCRSRRTSPPRSPRGTRLTDRRQLRRAPTSRLANRPQPPANGARSSPGSPPHPMEAVSTAPNVTSSPRKPAKARREHSTPRHASDSTRANVQYATPSANSLSKPPATRYPPTRLGSTTSPKRSASWNEKHDDLGSSGVIDTPPASASIGSNVSSSPQPARPPTHKTLLTATNERSPNSSRASPRSRRLSARSMTTCSNASMPSSDSSGPTNLSANGFARTYRN